MKNFDRIKIGFSWSLIGSFISKIMAFGSSIFFARYMGKVSYGELGIVQGTTGLLGIFAGAGMGLTGTRYVALLKNKDKMRISRILGLIIVSSSFFTILFCGIILVFANTISIQFLHNTSLSDILKLSIFLLLSNVAFEIISGILAGFEDFKSVSTGDMLRGTLLLPLAIYFTSSFGIIGAIISLAASNLLGISYLIYTLIIRLKENQIEIIFKNCLKEFGVIIDFAIPNLILSSLPIPVMWFSTTLLTSLPNGYGELGIYNATNQFRLMIMMVPVMLGRVLLPFLTEEYSKRNMMTFGYAIEESNLATIILILPTSVLFFFLGDKIMALFGKDFTAGWIVLVGMVAGTAISAIGSVIGSAIVATGNMWAGVMQNCLWAFVYMTIVLLKYKSQGAEALSDAFMCAHFVLLFSSIIFLKTKNLITNILFNNVASAVLIIIITSLMAQWMQPELRMGVAVPAFIIVIIICYRFYFSKKFLVNE
ncbi:MAG: oligosaccharide flippase family protein [Nitrospirae bacterium]|nr:oligosaccharide flippase family protein [Nitrospirota bacterium]